MAASCRRRKSKPAAFRLRLHSHEAVVGADVERAAVVAPAAVAGSLAGLEDAEQVAVGIGDTEAEAVGIDFLAHYLPAFFCSSSGVATTTVMWLVRLLILNARPCARGMKRRRTGP